MKIIQTTLLLAALLTGAAHAQSATPATSANADTMAQGEVRKVDPDKGKITLKHGPILSLDMPPMTMVFQVKEPAMLDGVKAGDKVRFAASNDGGKMTVTALEAVR